MVKDDPYLEPYLDQIKRRISLVKSRLNQICKENESLENFASGHEYFGLHHDENEWIFREWAPNATRLFLVGNFSNWHDDEKFELHRIHDHGIWELRLPLETLHHLDLYRLSIHWIGGNGQRIPAYARRAVQDEHTKIFNAQVWHPPKKFTWMNATFKRLDKPPIIYEAHIGMALDDGKVATYTDFKNHILPRIVDCGYNTIQLMAIQEHPYYASFGYHVSNFFAASSRFGTPEELKELIDAAHGHGIAVIMDLIHSHVVRNEVEGLSFFDGTDHLYFHTGTRGYHDAWDSRCFDYNKSEVIHFLLSNCRYWLDEFHFDGFRFDGITSMVYTHHGLGKAFTTYDDYFDGSVDSDALAYLTLANKLIHTIRPDALTIAEDMSGMPGLGSAIVKGGIGFDYRLGMGIPDYWIKTIKHVKDEDWNLGELWHELTNRRHNEKTISYAESHDQALVGDQTLIFRLIGEDMYHHMHRDSDRITVDRGVALHKMIRLITLAIGGEGYLNFMGNEFGHPEWIDFPREGNNWSFHHARRQWRLRDDPDLIYSHLAEFDKEIIKIATACDLLDAEDQGQLICHKSSDKLICFKRAQLIFIFNFNPSQSFNHLPIYANSGTYKLLLDSDAKVFNGHGRLDTDQLYHTQECENSSDTSKHFFSVYIPTRTAIILCHEA